MRAKLFRLERFDIAILAIIAACGVAIALVIARGDQVGLTIQKLDPTDTASSRATIHIMVDDAVNVDTVPSHFFISPSAPGKLTVNGSEITFQPSQAYVQGEEYTVTLRAGIESNSGRELKQDVQWQFRIDPPRIAYLSPADSFVQNLYMLDSSLSTYPIQLTTSPNGVLGYDPSPDGKSIVYAALQDKSAASLYVVDLYDGTSKLLYTCHDAKCSNPVYRPDGGAVAFERIELNTGTGMPSGVTRVWVLELATNTARPLFSDNQQLGYSPRWSPDGTRLALFDISAEGIVVHDFTTGKDTTIPTQQGGIGQFSPDGHWLSFPMLVKLSDGREVTHMALADMTKTQVALTDLQPSDDATDDREAVWLPDSARLLVTRPGSGEAVDALQVYSVDVTTHQTAPILTDPAYSQSNLQVNPAGDTLLFQRIRIDNVGGPMEIWTYDLKSGKGQPIAQDATIPRWIP